MSRILKRPMFKRGGTVNTGIMDGFSNGGEVERDRQTGKFSGMPSTFGVQDMLAMAREEAAQPTATEPVFTRREMEKEPIMDLADYASLFKLGAGIAGAPGRGSGLGGLLASASDPLQQFADEFGASQRAKAERRRAFEEKEDVREEAFKAEGRQFEREKQLLGIDDTNKTKQIMMQHRNKLEEIAADAEANPLELVEYTKQYNELVDRQMGLDPSSDEYKNIQRSIDALNRQYISPIVKSLAADPITSTKATSYAEAEITRIEEQRAKDGLEALSASEKADLKAKLEGKYYNIVAQASLGESDLDKAEGGRVGLQQGGQAMDTSPMLTFEELRARLPKEVSDQVVRLIATSEAALLDFANIDTQEDISIFNQKYNVDLQLPTQVA